jgi:hypothetical protein
VGSKRCVRYHHVQVCLRSDARPGNTFLAWANVSRSMHRWKINVQRSRRDVGADRGERPAPVFPCNLLTTTTLTRDNKSTLSECQCGF